jgi:hypothetical protein
MAEWIGSVRELVAEGWREAPCAACGRWVVTDDRVILDRDPTDDGDTVIRPARRGKAQATGVIREDVVGRMPLWRSHFYTCPRGLLEADRG